MSDSLSPDDRQLLEELFDRAAELPPAEHAGFVARECGSKDALREELERLLAGLAGEDIVTRIQPVAPTRSGTRIGAYVLRERIGEGGMGEVYAAEQREPVVRRVALKLIKPGMDSAQVVARFEAERQALARMSHPHVAQVLGGGTTDDGRPYFVMELVDGEPITGYCDHRALSTRDRLELFLGVCAGVQHAHQKGLIHRDIKPSNLLVMQQDGQAVPKVIDFGVARAVTGTLADRTLHTMVGQVLGTLDYMSPEQADPSGLDVDTRSDVYSLGVVLYQLVSGLLPFDYGASKDTPLSEIQRAIREEDPPTPSSRLRRQTGTATSIAKQRGVDERSLVRQLSGDLDWICLKALEKDPDRRYASVSELADDVRRHLAHEPVLAGRPGALYRARKFVRRHRVGVTAGALVVGSVIAGVVGIISARNEAEAAATRAENALVDLTRVSAPGMLEVLKREADEDLWPPKMESIPAYDAWLQEAEALVAGLEPAVDGSDPGFRQQLVTLRERALPWTEEERTFSFADVEDARAHQQLVALIAGLEQLADPETGLIDGTGISEEHGWSIRRRQDYAVTLAEQTLTGSEARALWSEAIASIADRGECPAYDGLQLSPQLGLLPLGRDQDSGLWEFAHLMSGAPAVRDPQTGRIGLTAETGLVFVLVPGGTFTMGAQSADPDEPNYDPEALTQEGPPYVVESLPPFFISKYEMMFHQWVRFAGTNPNEIPSKDWSLRPIWGPSQLECLTLTHRLGLGLPTEEQWEYAAKGGTTTIWWTGDEEGSLEGAENLYDQSCLENRRWTTVANYGEPPMDWDDGNVLSADVGSYRANPFGLHDTQGNVTEWTSSPLYVYSKGPEQSSPAGRFGIRVARGGNNRSGSRSARPTWRGFNNHGAFKDVNTGLRPTRAVDP